MKIKIKENSGNIFITLKWKSKFTEEHKTIRITGYTIGKKYETIAEELALFFKEMDSKGRMKF